MFEQQLELTYDIDKSVYLHERDAFEEVVAILSRHKTGITGGVIHCFTGERAALEAYLELGLHIGITGWICDEALGCVTS